jgi:twitching motility two-component system response regulator PilG
MLSIRIRQRGKGHGPMSCVAIIDDSVVVRKIVETSMSRVGVSCLSFRDGYEALRVFQTQLSRPPDLVFLDINLPLIDGFDLLRLLKNQPGFEQMVIVILSSRDSVLDRVKCRLAGARAYLVKPFRTQDLLAVVALYLPAFYAQERPQGAPPFLKKEIL